MNFLLFFVTSSVFFKFRLILIVFFFTFLLFHIQVHLCLWSITPPFTSVEIPTFQLYTFYPCTMLVNQRTAFMTLDCRRRFFIIIFNIIRYLLKAVHVWCSLLSTTRLCSWFTAVHCVHQGSRTQGQTARHKFPFVRRRHTSLFALSSRWYHARQLLIDCNNASLLSAVGWQALTWLTANRLKLNTDFCGSVQSITSPS